MFGSGILDTVIGLMFVFLLVSLMVTIMNEMIASAMQSRAKWLRLGIERLVGTHWMKRMYAHPLIEGTSHKSTTEKAEDGGPSYIPSRSFANVLMDVITENSSGIADCQKALREALVSASAAGATVDGIRQQMATIAAGLQTGGGVQAAVGGDLLHRLEGPGADPRKWLAELEARVGELAKTERPELDGLLHSLRTLVADGIAARASVDELRQRFSDAVDTLLNGPATAALKDELTAMARRLQGPYTVADALADIHWFIDGISARYLRQVLEELPDSEGRMRKLLLTLFDDAQNDVEKFKQNLEVWFNNSMDRVNGWYKRYAQRVTLALSAVTVVAMNVDAIAIFKHLQTYPAAREALVAQAQQYVKNDPLAPLTGAGARVPAGTLKVLKNGEKRTVLLKSDHNAIKVLPASFEILPGSTEIPFKLDLPVVGKGGPVKVWAEDGSTDTVTLTVAPGLPDQFSGVRSTLTGLSLPIGWASAPADPSQDTGPEPGGWSQLGSGLQHLLGWILTALAASLGAPFWFDMLNRVISIRAAGKPPEEEPKPPKSVSVPLEPGQSPQEADRLRHNALRR